LPDGSQLNVDLQIISPTEAHHVWGDGIFNYLIKAFWGKGSLLLTGNQLTYMYRYVSLMKTPNDEGSILYQKWNSKHRNISWLDTYKKQFEFTLAIIFVLGLNNKYTSIVIQIWLFFCYLFSVETEEDLKYITSVVTILAAKSYLFIYNIIYYIIHTTPPKHKLMQHFILISLK